MENKILEKVREICESENVGTMDKYLKTNHKRDGDQPLLILHDHYVIPRAGYNPG